MNIHCIKPIPKYIKTKILHLDTKRYPEQKGLRFYSYFTTMQKELVKITVAIRNKNKDLRLIKQVAVHGVNSETCLVRDLEYCYLGICAYRVGWFDEGIKYPHGRPHYNDNKWYSIPDKYYDPYAPAVNIEYVLKLKQFRYSAIGLAQPVNPIRYLRLYLKYPQIEYLVKLGFKNIAYSTMILNKCGKDKNFCKWLIANKYELQQNRYYVAVILRAYGTGKPLNQLQQYATIKNRIKSDGYMKRIRDIFGNKIENFIDYIIAQDTSVYTYLDYHRACTYLNLDMTLPQNLYPHNFKYWHDIRIDEYATAKALADKKEREQFYMSFAAIAEKYSALQHNKRGAFICVIAKSPADLVREGEVLHHCVGRMNYDQRVIKEQSLIFFIRTREQPDVPYVTVEYSLYTHKVLQCYGDHDSKPSDEVLHYVNKVWLPYANKNLKQRAAALIT